VGTLRFAHLRAGVIIPALAGDTITSNNNVQLVKDGINYRFNWGLLGSTRY
jgi:hypothetical protein